MNSKKTTIALLCASAGALAAVISVTALRPHFVGINAGATENAIYFQADKNVLVTSAASSDGNANAESEKGNFFAFDYTGLSALTSGWQTLAANGTLASATRMGRIESVQMTLTDDSDALNAKISWGWTAGAAVRTTNLAESAFDFDGDLPDYFTITAAYGELEIEKLVVKYECSSYSTSNRYTVVDDLAGSTFAHANYDGSEKFTIEVVDHNEILISGGELADNTSFKLSERDGSYFVYKHGADVARIYVNDADSIQLYKSNFGGKEFFNEEFARVLATEGFDVAITKRNGHGKIASDLESQELPVDVDTDIKVSDRVIVRIDLLPEGATDDDYTVYVLADGEGDPAVGVHGTDTIPGSSEWDEELGDFVEIPAQTVHTYDFIIEDANGYVALDAYKAGNFKVKVTLNSDPTIAYESATFTVREFVNVAGWTISGLTAGSLALEKDAAADLTVSATNAAADYKEFAVSTANNKVATASIVDGKVRVRGAGAGTTTITVTAKDPGAAQQSFDVTVSEAASIIPSWFGSSTYDFDDCLRLDVDSEGNAILSYDGEALLEEFTNIAVGDNDNERVLTNSDGYVMIVSKATSDSFWLTILDADDNTYADWAYSFTEFDGVKFILD